MQSLYAVYGSKLHLVLDDDFAETWNRANQKFFDAQAQHKERTGHAWDALNEHLAIEWNEKEQEVFNKFAGFMNTYIEFLGGGLNLGADEFFPSNFLDKIEEMPDDSGTIRWFVQVEIPEVRLV